MLDDDLCVVDLWAVEACADDLLAVDECAVDLCADDECAVDLWLVVVFLLLACVDPVLAEASLDCWAFSSSACFSTAAARAGSVLVVMSPLVPCA